jgi:hypothetical protein
MMRLAHMRFNSSSSVVLSKGQDAVATKGGHDDDAQSEGKRRAWTSWDDTHEDASGLRPEAVQARLIRDLLSGGAGGKKQLHDQEVASSGLSKDKPDSRSRSPAAPRDEIRDSETQDSESENGVVQQEIELYKWVQLQLRPAIISSGLLTSLGTRETSGSSSGPKPPRAATAPLILTNPAVTCSSSYLPSRPLGSEAEGQGKRGPRVPGGKKGDERRGSVSSADSKTAALAAAEASEGDLAKVLLAYLPKNEPLKRVLDYYRNLQAREQAERGRVQKGAAGSEKQAGDEFLSLDHWKRFLTDFDVLPSLLGRRCAEILYQRSFAQPAMQKHPLYAKFALALAHTSIFVFQAKTVEQGARELLAHLHASNGVDIVRAGCSSSSKPLLLVTANELSASARAPASSSNDSFDDEGGAPGAGGNKTHLWDRAEEFKTNGLKKAAGARRALALPLPPMLEC